MGRFVDLSLASRDAESSIRLHDFQLDFVRGEHPNPGVLTLQHSALLRSIQIVRPHPEQFGSQMTARLLGHEEQSEIRELLKNLYRNVVRPCLWPLWPALEQA